MVKEEYYIMLAKKAIILYNVYTSHDEIVEAVIIFSEEINNNNTVQCNRYIYSHVLVSISFTEH